MSAGGQTEKNSVRAYVFRFALKLGHGSMPSACLTGAISGNCEASFDHLVGAGKQRCWHLEAEAPSRLEIDDELESSRLLHRQIGGL
jgi:hypothetical protein